MSDALEMRLVEIVRADADLMHVLTTVRGLGLPDWRVFSGAVYQSVWNAVTGRPGRMAIFQNSTSPSSAMMRLV